MVEVVQDLLDHVTYAGGVGRRRVDAVRGLGAGTPAPSLADAVAVPEDPSDPRGPRLVPMLDLLTNDVLDRDFEEKAYRFQLEEFAYRGERIIKQVDQKLGEVQRMIGHDVLRRSRQLPALLRSANDELRRVHLLVCGELEEVWHLRFEPLFYPSEEDGQPAGEPALPGGWLDLDDMFLTTRLLIRYLAELVDLVHTMVKQLPLEVLESRSLVRSRLPDPALHAIVAAFAARLPWIGASLLTDAEVTEKLAASPDPIVFEHLATSLPAPEAEEARAGASMTENRSPLNQAITSLDRVLTLRLKNLLSELHRTMYQTFFRICAAYARWKRMFTKERKSCLKALRVPTETLKSRTQDFIKPAEQAEASSEAANSRRASAPCIAPRISADADVPSAASAERRANTDIPTREGKQLQEMD